MYQKSSTHANPSIFVWHCAIKDDKVKYGFPNSIFYWWYDLHLASCVALATIWWNINKNHNKNQRKNWILSIFQGLMVIESASLLFQTYDDNVCHVGLRLCIDFGYADLSQPSKRRKYEDFCFTNESLWVIMELGISLEKMIMRLSNEYLKSFTRIKSTKDEVWTTWFNGFKMVN